MTIIGKLRKPAVQVINRFGYLTKQQCVDVSTNIGKELVDLTRQNGRITRETVQKVVKKHCPNVNVNFVNEQQMKELLGRHKMSPKQIENYLANIGGAAGHFPEGSFIYLPDKMSEISTKDIPVVAHELEHYC